jgi:hypothetical protein
MWLRSLGLATVFVTFSLPAMAWSGPADVRKWKALVPTVRASTDCIARAIVASPTARGHARQEKWDDAVNIISDDCKSFRSRLVAEHDRLYGPGTGKRFLEGPYAADLPRALKARIGVQLERLAAEPAHPEGRLEAAEAGTSAPADAGATARLPKPAAKAEEQVSVGPSLSRGEATGQQAAEAGTAENPTEAVREQPVAQSPSEAITAQAVAQSPSEAPVGAPAAAESPNEAAAKRGVTTEQVPAPPAENVAPIDAHIASKARERRLDRPGRPSYGLVLLLLLLPAALYGWRYARRKGTNRGGEERSVLFRARRIPPPADGQVRDQPEPGTAAPPANTMRERMPALTGS